MNNYIFPFQQLNHLNDLYSDEILPFEQYSTLSALSSSQPINNISHNSSDEIDREIVDSNYVPCNYMDLKDFSELSGPEKLSLLHYNINSIPKHLDDFASSTLGDGIF